LKNLIAETEAFAHLVVHWTGGLPSKLEPRPLVSHLSDQPVPARADVLTNAQLLTNVGATVGRFTIPDCITSDGFNLLQPWSGFVTDWNTSMNAHASAGAVGTSSRAVTL
ncbi:MAG TPA: hypothetical protein VFC03_12995, partial [Acidimicrobiales bacterium]|nr:hypothetical protein [Acidimicrobiales bacterium]